MSDFFFWKTVLKFTHILSHSRTHLFFKINLGAWSVWLNFVEKRDGASWSSVTCQRVTSKNGTAVPCILVLGLEFGGFAAVVCVRLHSGWLTFGKLLEVWFVGSSVQAILTRSKSQCLLELPLARPDHMTTPIAKVAGRVCLWQSKIDWPKCPLANQDSSPEIRYVVNSNKVGVRQLKWRARQWLGRWGPVTFTGGLGYSAPAPALSTRNILHMQEFSGFES